MLDPPCEAVPHRVPVDIEDDVEHGFGWGSDVAVDSNWPHRQAS